MIPFYNISTKASLTRRSIDTAVVAVGTKVVVMFYSVLLGECTYVRTYYCDKIFILNISNRAYLYYTNSSHNKLHTYIIH